MNLEEHQTQDLVPDQEQPSPIEVADNLEEQTATSEEVTDETLVETPQVEPAEASTDNVVAVIEVTTAELVTDETAEFNTIAEEIEVAVVELVADETAEPTTVEDVEAVTALAENTNCGINSACRATTATRIGITSRSCYAASFPKNVEFTDN